ncbi:HEPN domain-containing protein [Roseixanthobacter liquoris]|uniref:hypothetical protein n=1 Tax=Roseixanthobacter liquoris TaxID=3119921 RepID=UPI0037286031
MAESYVVAVEGLVPQAETASAPFHMLVGHALELLLKAVLAQGGRDEEWLMMTGHNLAYCYREALSIGPSGLADEKLALLVDTLDGQHRDQRFRYPMVLGGAAYLIAGDAAETLRRLLEDVSTWLSARLPRSALADHRDRRHEAVVGRRHR